MAKIIDFFKENIKVIIVVTIYNAKNMLPQDFSNVPMQ